MNLHALHQQHQPHNSFHPETSMKKAKKTLHLCIESKLSEVALVGHAVRGVCSQTPLEKEAYDEMEICVVEAVTNAISHAYHYKPGFRVEAAISLHDDRIAFEVSEYGTAIDNFTPKKLEFDPEEPATLPESGMGLYIIGTIMDDVSYSSTAGKNTLSFCRYFPTGSKSTATS